MLGRDLTEVYSGARLKLAADRHMVSQLLKVDMREMFSPERVTSVCKKYGLVPAQAMDLENGYNFDLTADRKKAWESTIRDEPTLVIRSPPCTFFSRLQ